MPHSSNKVFFQICPGKSGNGHFQPTSLFAALPRQIWKWSLSTTRTFCHFGLSENKAGTVTAEGILSFEVVKWRVAALNQQCLSVLILANDHFQPVVYFGWLGTVKSQNATVSRSVILDFGK